jgi:iron(II)-dependent oxidoreductase
MKCRDCSQEVQSGWNNCPYCGNNLKDFTVSLNCPNCQNWIQKDWCTCPLCGYRLNVAFLDEKSEKTIFIPQEFRDFDPTNIDIIKKLIRMDMVYIASEEFIMGSMKYPEEQPQKTVFVGAFWMCKFAVTNKQYRTYVQETNYHPGRFDQDTNFNRDKQPVVGVSFLDAVSYCKWLSEKTCFDFRLPFEAEWEKSAGGWWGRKYPWGNCWERDRCNNEELGLRRTSEVTCYPYGPSPNGLCNMAGNVWEWCQDWYSENYYKVAPLSNRLGPKNGTEKVARGGAWDSNGNDIRVTKRKAFPPDTCQSNIGFRLACNNPFF